MKSGDKPHLAIMGTRGIPARYGGFETFAEELSTRLASRGYSVTVYGRRFFGSEPVTDRQYRGVTIRTIATLPFKYLETPLHGLLSFLDLFRRQYDVVLLCNAANTLTAWIVKLFRTPLIVNVDGIERKRKKWGAVGRVGYRLGELCSVWFADRIVADAEVIGKYYADEYRVESEIIAYGADPKRVDTTATLKQFELEPQRYLLYVSRLEPENNALGVIEAFGKVESDLKLVIVGDAPYAKAYKQKLIAAANSKVVFTGFQFEQAYHELRSHCYLYIQATEVGGTHPALVEAMAFGNCIVANDVPEHREVLGDSGRYYRKNDWRDLENQLRRLIAVPEEVQELGQRAAERASERYSWDRIVDQYEQMLGGLLKDRTVASGERDVGLKRIQTETQDQ